MQLSKDQPWMVNGTIGGYMSELENQVLYTTVSGAGHMASMDKPEASLKIFNEFLLGL